MDYEVVIGLEVHAQLQTATKLFCADGTTFGAPPNTEVSAVSLALPGTLPRLNRAVIPLALRLGLSLGCTVNRRNYFARKNYFYPDLPKGYQISQHKDPILQGGSLSVTTATGTRSIRIHHIHLEEDAGKSLHDADWSRIDYNRAGTPLLEIVSEPDLRSGEEAAAYVGELRRLLRHLGVCDGNMQEGSLRCDVNISVRPAGDPQLGTRVEIKNLNSLRFIRKAAEWEAARLIGLHREGKPIRQETRGFNESEGTTYSIRLKEDEEDYRYFPEPDLPPFEITEAEIEAVRATLPPHPRAAGLQLEKTWGLNAYDAGLLVSGEGLVPLFEALTREGVPAKPAANWCTGPVRSWLEEGEERRADSLPVPALAHLIQLTEARELSWAGATGTVFPELAAHPGTDLARFIEARGLRLSSNTEDLEAWIGAALEAHPQKITEFRRGKKGLLALFVGEVMKRSGGKADAKEVSRLLLEKLK